MEEQLASKIVELQNLSAYWSIGASIASIVLAIVAIFLAVYFYSQAKKTEKEVSSSLSKIETQADALGKISGRQLDRLTKHVTEQRTAESQPEIKALVEIATTISQGFAHNLPTAGAGDRIETLKYLIACYYYCGLSNYYAYMSLPPPSDFDDINQFHNLTKIVLDQSHNDVQFLRSQLANANRTDIEATGIAHLYDEAEKEWAPRSKDSAKSFVSIQQIMNET